MDHGGHGSGGDHDGGGHGGGIGNDGGDMTMVRNTNNNCI